MCELSFFIGKGDLLLITTGKNRFSPVRRTFEGAEAGRQSASPERKKDALLFYCCAYEGQEQLYGIKEKGKTENEHIDAEWRLEKKWKHRNCIRGNEKSI